MSLIGNQPRFGRCASNAVECQSRVTWPQQIEADSIKTATVRLDTIFRRRHMGSRIVTMTHDAMWIEAPQEEEAAATHLIWKRMTTAHRLRVSLMVDFE